MVQVATFNAQSGASGQREFRAELGETPLYRTMKDVVVQLQSNQRQSDAHTKTRGELAGHAKKPWKQKHTGRARHGDRRSPLWRGGATTFGPRNTRRWKYYLPQRQRNVALRSALLGKLQDGEVKEFSGFAPPEPAAKQARRLLGACAPAGTVLVLLAEPNPALWKSFRNFPRVSVRSSAEVNAYDLLAHKWLLAQEGALEKLSGRLAAPRVPPDRS